MAIYFLVSLFIANSIAFKGSKVLISLFALELGANPFAVGILVSLYALFPLLLAVYAGKLSDRLGVRLPMMLGSCGVSLGLLLPYLWPRLSALYLSPILIGMSHIFFHVSMHNLVGSIGDSAARTRNYSTMSLGAAVGALIGPVSAGLLIDNVGHVSTYFWFFVIALVPAAGIYFFPHLMPKRKKRPEREEHTGSTVDLFKNRPLRRTFIVSGMVLTGIELFTFYFPIYGKSIGLSATAIGLVLGAYAAAAFFVRLIMPRLAQRFSEEGVLTYSLFIAGATYLLFPLFQHPFVLGMVAFILGLGLGCGQPLSIILTYNHSPQGRSGEALGVRIMVNKITQIAVPMFFGSLGAAFGLWPVFWSNAAFLLSGGYISFNGRDRGAA